MPTPEVYTTSPGWDAVAVTPSDVTVLDKFRGLYIGVAGNVALVTPNGTTTTFVGLAAGSILPVAGTKVMSTNTTATSIVALY